VVHRDSLILARGIQLENLDWLICLYKNRGSAFERHRVSCLVGEKLREGKSGGGRF